MAVLNTQAACDARFTDNATKKFPAGPITYGVSNGEIASTPAFPGSVGVVGAQPTSVSITDRGPFPWWEQDQFR